MSFKHFINQIQIAKKIMSRYVSKGDIVADCTVGQGNDTLFLAKLVGQTGKVYGFDIQSIAIDITKKKLIQENLIENVVLVNDGHENIDNYINEKIDFIIYNLGYLPKGNKEIKTNAITTLKSVEKSLNLLKNNGLLLITCYTGHEGGLLEKEAVKKFLKNLDQKKYNVLEFNFINQKNNPPILYGIEKL